MLTTKAVTAQSPGRLRTSLAEQRQKRQQQQQQEALKPKT
jgi:hypothetical protein